jgi:putative membrane protein
MDTKKQLNAGTYYHSSLLIQIMTAVIFIVSVLLIFYLVKSI